ncbi:F-box protein [Paraburkholderia humisilvae]|uniref:F-box protein n=1 Tax=Paraburkholderia humisilvae TaxID=627669 RepID=UPI0015823B85|nr:F-box protein [Paraburkholderia humisilvae]
MEKTTVARELQNLPREDIHEIASFLEPKDVLALASTSKKLQTHLSIHEDAARITQRAAGLRTIEDLPGTLAALERIPPQHRSAAMSSIAYSTRRLAVPDRTIALSQALDALDSLSAPYAIAPLTAFGSSISSLLISDRAMAFDRIISALEVRFAERASEPLANLIDSIADLPEADQPGAFDRVFNLLAQQPATPGRETAAGMLLRASSLLPAAHRTTAYSQVVDKFRG